MDIYDFLVEKPKHNIKGSSLTTSAEADDFGIPTGTAQDNISEGPSMDDGNMDFGTDNGMMDMTTDEFGNQELETPDGKIQNPLDDIEDADLSLTTEIRENFTSLYNDSKANYEKILSRNLDSSEFGTDFKEIQEQYKAILQNIRLYMKNKFNKESIVTKVLQLNDFKMQINTLHTAVNTLSDKLGVKDDSVEVI
mgnify:CR=1 FL=1